MNKTAGFLFVGLCGLSLPPAMAERPYEVWSVDQSNSAGTFGGRLYIHDGKDLERGIRAAEAVPEVIDLSAAASALCFARCVRT